VTAARRAIAGPALVIALAACGGSSTKTTIATTAPAAAASGPTTTALPGTTFTDPDGTYTVRVDPDWSEQPNALPQNDIEVWQTAPSVDGFASNVNVLTQPAKGVSLAEYLDASVKQLKDMTVVDSSTVDVGGGRTLGTVEYSGLLTGATKALHFLAVVDVGDGKAVLATFTATEDAFTSLRPTIERYLLTLRRT
jgi:hypothetical protein